MLKQLSPSGSFHSARYIFTSLRGIALYNIPNLSSQSERAKNTLLAPHVKGAFCRRDVCAFDNDRNSILRRRKICPESVQELCLIDLVIIRGFIFFFETSISVLLQPFGTITLGQDLTMIDREKQTRTNLSLETHDF